MKRKAIIAAMMSALMFASCGTNTTEADAADTDRIAETTAGSESLGFVSDSTETPAGTSGGEDSSNTENTESTDITDSTETQTGSSDGSGLPANMRIVKTGNYIYAVPVGDYICISTYDSDDLNDRTAVLKFIDKTTGEVKGESALPKGKELSKITAGNGDVLCWVSLSEYHTDDYSNPDYKTYLTAAVKSNFTVDVSGEYDEEIVFYDHFGRSVAEHGLDIINSLDSSGKVLIEGYKDEYDFKTRWQMYMFPIDEDRFVYRTGGYECLPGFGIYDFSKGAAKEVPESADFIPKGYRSGKIYSVKTSWDGMGTELYVTDAETLETSFFMDLPFDVVGWEWVEYAMPESGDYIVISKNWSTDEDGNILPARLYKINADTAKVEAEYEIPAEYAVNQGFFWDNDTYAMNYSDNGEDAFVLVDLR